MFHVTYKATMKHPSVILLYYRTHQLYDQISWHLILIKIAVS